MLSLVTGGSGSGKSEYAEMLITADRDAACELIYIATMKPFDAECEKRIERHQQMRKHKGFRTIECYEDIHKLDIPKGAFILLECMSNLLANELYTMNIKTKNTAAHIMKGIAHILNECGHLVVVTNEVFSDGISYDEETVKYIKDLAAINCKLGEIADSVTEVVCGIPIHVKQVKQ